MEEVANGGELMERIVAMRTFSEKDASRLFRQMCDAVEWCHSKRVVVRDLKPENFIFETKAQDSAIKLTDFGLATSIETPDSIITDACGS